MIKWPNSTLFNQQVWIWSSAFQLRRKLLSHTTQLAFPVWRKFTWVGLPEDLTHESGSQVCARRSPLEWASPTPTDNFLPERVRRIALRESGLQVCRNRRAWHEKQFNKVSVGLIAHTVPTTPFSCVLAWMKQLVLATAAYFWAT